MRLSFLWLLTTVMIAANGCSNFGNGDPQASDELLGPLPATFAGRLPCADCAGIDYHLDLFPDYTFHLRADYVGESGGPFDAIGRWRLSSDDRVLVLSGGRPGPRQFHIDGPDAVTLLNLKGEPIESELNYTLNRADEPDPFEPRLRMSGMYSYLADAGAFRECLTGHRMPVAMEADNVSLERAYREARREPGQPILVILQGRIVRRMPMEGPGPVRMLVPSKFEKVVPGETCGHTVRRH